MRQVERINHGLKWEAKVKASSRTWRLNGKEYGLEGFQSTLTLFLTLDTTYRKSQSQDLNTTELVMIVVLLSLAPVRKQKFDPDIIREIKTVIDSDTFKFETIKDYLQDTHACADKNSEETFIAAYCAVSEEFCT